MTGAWALSTRDVVPDTRPRTQRCATCGLIYRRVRLERREDDPYPMCRLVELRREEQTREATR